MKILLREYGRERYVWKSAKYNKGYFCVDGEDQPQHNIVSIDNDNRKKYAQCSCCGQIFRKGDLHKFQEHKENAIKPETCFGCPHLYVDGSCVKRKKYTVNFDGTFSEMLEREVSLKCSRTGSWAYYDINDSRTINYCKRRQCGDAKLEEINDFFTKYPGVFDDIITIDKLLDAGYDVGTLADYGVTQIIAEEIEYVIQAEVNRIGIVDCFNIYYDDDWYRVYYSRRYDNLFWYHREYKEWLHPLMSTELKNEIKEHIAKLYR